jgi:BirA family biotin operon repressor/biotin-[acetyl-CoA-carboxylase] ligase
MADSQTIGRGQRGNTWLSEAKKNLLVSFVFKPDNLSVENQVHLTWVTSLSIIETLAKFNIKAQVKWPNDILVSGNKIAGILIENQILGDKISSSIIGIGLNVNQHDFDGISATSILNESGSETSIKEFFNSLCESMNHFFFKLNSQQGDFLKFTYQKNLFQKNEICLYEDNNSQFQGEIIGVNENGLLQIKVNSDLREYGIKEIRYLSK